jgi:hypothetical protein
MPRTTLDLDASILRDLKRLGREQGKSLGELVSELVAQALSGRRRRKPAPFEWISQPMGAPRVDLKDKDAVWAILDEDRRG